MAEPTVVVPPVVEETPGIDDNGGANPPPVVDEKGTPAVVAAPPPAAPAELTDEQTLMAVRKLSGNNEITLEDAKKYFESKPIEPTAEERTKKEIEEENEVISLFTNTQKADKTYHTAEEYTFIKGAAKLEPKELGKRALMEELQDEFKDASAEEIQGIYNQRMGIHTEEELELMDDKEKATAERIAKIAQKSLEARGKDIKDQYTNYISGFKDQITSQKTTANTKKEYAVQAAETIGKMPVDLTFNIGTVGDQPHDFGDLGFEVPEAVITEAKQLFGDLDKVNKFLFTDGKPNVETLARMYIAEKSQHEMLKKAASHYRSEGVKSVQSTLSPKPPGVGGEKRVEPVEGKVARIGEPQPFFANKN